MNKKTAKDLLIVESPTKAKTINKFLANIREVDMILQVVRDFEDTNIVREHSKTPNIDTDVINSELLLKDIDSLQKKIATLGSNQNKQEELNIYNYYLNKLNNGTFAFDIRKDLLEESKEYKLYKEFVKPLFLLTDKDMIYVFNTSEEDERITKETNENLYKERDVVFICAKLESELASLSNEDQKTYLEELGIKEPGLDKIIRKCYEKLGLISFFTAGEKEVRSWEIKKNSNAVEASGRIHTDFMNKFIKAEVISYSAYVETETKAKAREAGKLRLEGKEYIVKDGDVIEFRIGA